MRGRDYHDAKWIFTELRLEGYEIIINSRKFLTGLSEYLGQPDKENQLCVAIDKLEKIGQEKVFQELAELGFDENALNNLEPVLSTTGDNQEKLNKLSNQFASIEAAKDGLNEVKQVLDLVKKMSGDTATVSFEPSLARGLSYYTGIIFEVRMLDGSIGSICGGGRYDDLTGVFGMPDVSGVGISLGIERIYDVIESRSLFKEDLNQNTKVLIINFGDENKDFALSALGELRRNNISSELYPDTAKMKKQMSYADKNNIPIVIIAGAQEVETNTINVKDMNSGEQKTSSINELITTISSILN